MLERPTHNTLCVLCVGFGSAFVCRAVCRARDQSALWQSRSGDWARGLVAEYLLTYLRSGRVGSRRLVRSCSQSPSRTTPCGMTRSRLSRLPFAGRTGMQRRDAMAVSPGAWIRLPGSSHTSHYTTDQTCPLALVVAPRVCQIPNPRPLPLRVIGSARVSARPRSCHAHMRRKALLRTIGLPAHGICRCKFRCVVRPKGLRHSSHSDRLPFTRRLHAHRAAACAAPCRP